MKRIIAGLCLLPLLLAAFSGCIRINFRETVDLTGEMTSFTAVPDAAADEYDITIEDLILTGSAELSITPSDEPRVEVECRKSLLDYGFEVVFDGETLRIACQHPQLTFRGGNLKLHIYANYRSIELAGGYDLAVDGTGMDEIRLGVSGAVNGEMKNLDAADVTIRIAGAGSIRMEGKTDALAMDVAGAAKVDAEALTAATAKIDIAGAGTVTMTVTDALDAGISGTGSVHYYGDPENVNARVSGAGSIKPAA